MSQRALHAPGLVLPPARREPRPAPRWLDLPAEIVEAVNESFLTPIIHGFGVFARWREVDPLDAATLADLGLRDAVTLRRGPRR